MINQFSMVLKKWLL